MVAWVLVQRRQRVSRQGQMELEVGEGGGARDGGGRRWERKEERSYPDKDLKSHSSINFIISYYILRRKHHHHTKEPFLQSMSLWQQVQIWDSVAFNGCVLRISCRIGLSKSKPSTSSFVCVPSSPISVLTYS